MTLKGMVERTEGISVKSLNALRSRASQSYDVLDLRKMVAELADVVVVLKERAEAVQAPAEAPVVVTAAPARAAGMSVGEDGHTYLDGWRVVTQK